MSNIMSGNIDSFNFPFASTACGPGKRQHLADVDNFFVLRAPARVLRCCWVLLLVLSCVFKLKNKWPCDRPMISMSVGAASEFSGGRSQSQPHHSLLSIFSVAISTMHSSLVIDWSLGVKAPPLPKAEVGGSCFSERGAAQVGGFCFGSIDTCVPSACPPLVIHLICCCFTLCTSRLFLPDCNPTLKFVSAAQHCFWYALLHRNTSGDGCGHTACIGHLYLRGS